MSSISGNATITRKPADCTVAEMRDFANTRYQVNYGGILHRDFTRNSVLSRITCVISRTQYLTHFVCEIAHNRAITHCTRNCANISTRDGSH